MPPEVSLALHISPAPGMIKARRRHFFRLPGSLFLRSFLGGLGGEAVICFTRLFLYSCFVPLASLKTTLFSLYSKSVALGMIFPFLRMTVSDRTGEVTQSQNG